MGLPQYIFLGLAVFSLGIALEQHGKPRSPSSFWVSLVSSAITLGLLWWGGFFG